MMKGQIYMNKKLNLPPGWLRAIDTKALQLYEELQRELVKEHILYGKNIKVFAHRDGANDDILVQHLNHPNRWTVVHLTWSGKKEVNNTYPAVIFDGTYEDYEKACTSWE